MSVSGEGSDKNFISNPLVLSALHQPTLAPRCSATLYRISGTPEAISYRTTALILFSICR